MRPPRFNPLEAAQLGALCGFLLALGGLWIGVLHNPYSWPLALVVLGGLAGWVVGILYANAMRRPKGVDGNGRNSSPLYAYFLERFAPTAYLERLVSKPLQV